MTEQGFFCCFFHPCRLTYDLEYLLISHQREPPATAFFDFVTLSQYQCTGVAFVPQRSFYKRILTEA